MPKVSVILFKKNSQLMFLLTGIIVSCLSYSDIFIYKSLTPYFLYSTGIAVIFIYAGIMALKVNESSYPTLPLALYSFIALAVYILFHSYLYSGNLNSYSFYLVLNIFFLVSLFRLIEMGRIDTRSLLQIIALASLGESVICLLQYIGVLTSMNPNFRVTGTWENPNVIAMFIAMTLPCYLTLKGQIRSLNYLFYIGLTLLVCSLILLQCRTAMIGAFLGFLSILNTKYQLSHRIKLKENRAAVSLIVCIGLGVFVPLINYSYQSKKASADGRRLIWKVSTSMIAEKPVFGFGYGTFEKNYNLFQSAYFEKRQRSPDELRNAGFVRMAYNEFIQNTVEGGFLGLFLFIGALLSLLIVRVPNKEGEGDVSYNDAKISRTGIVIFSAMSLFNFSIQAIPVMCIFVIYSAIICYSPPRKLKKLKFNILNIMNRLRYAVLSLCLISVGTWLIWKTAFDIGYNFKNKQAAENAKNGHYSIALATLSELSGPLEKDESFWTNYANTLFADHDYLKAETAFNKAKSLTSKPLIYLRLANCYEILGDYGNAIHNLLIAAFMEPNHIQPRFEIMGIYLKRKDTASVVREGEMIMGMVPKIASEKAYFYKSQTVLVLQMVGHPYRFFPNKPADIFHTNKVY